MATTVSYKKFSDPRNASKINQIFDLISRGKESIIPRDPALRPFYNTILKANRDQRIQLQLAAQKAAQSPTQAEIAAGQSLVDRSPGVPPTRQEEIAQQSLIDRGKLKGTPKNVPRELQPFTGEQIQSAEEYIESSKRSEIQRRKLEQQSRPVSNFLIEKGLLLPEEERGRRTSGSLPEETMSFSQLLRSEDPSTKTALVRKSFSYLGEELFKTSTLVTGQEANQQQVTQGGKFIGETLLFTGFLAPASTTTQIEKTLFEPAKIRFAGAQQKIADSGTVQTDLVFDVMKGRSSEKGIARALSVIKQGEEGSAIFTIAKGGTIKNYINFPSSKIVTRFAKTFEGAEVSLAKSLPEKNVVASISSGKVKSGGVLVDYKAASLSASDQNMAAIFGKSFSSRGQANTAGIIKLSNEKASTSFFSGGGAGSQELKKVSSSVQNIVGQAFGKQKVTTRVIPKVETKTFVPNTSKTETQSYSINLPKQEQQIITTSLVNITTKQDAIPKTTLSFKSATSTLQKTKQKTKQKQKQEAIQTSIPAQSARTLTNQKLRYRQITKQITRQESRKIPGIPTTSPRFSTSAFRFSLPKSVKKKKKKSIFTVEVRRGGKFKTIAKAPSLSKAFSIGTGVTGRTLAASFRVKGVGSKPIKIPGYTSRKGGVFVEKRGRRLATRGEIGEITRARYKL